MLGLALLLGACSAQSSAVAPKPQMLPIAPPSRGAAAEEARSSQRPEPSPIESAPSIVIDSGTATGPWTHLNVPRPGPTVRFAVIADRTGGVRQEVFASAIPKINALGPDLVLSVGDLISGYKDNPKTLAKEWDEVDKLLRRLQAPFFYVAGNHDVLGQAPREVWKKRLGPTYYAFVYAGLLFVCLDTIEPELGQIQDEQLVWLEQVLKRHRNVEWTFVFLHVPLWDGGDAARRDAWKRISAKLGKRRYTAFAGHHHRYVKHQRGQHGLYTLATTGGGRGSRGPQYGEFDHVAWVTVTDRGPVVANLALDGILGDDVRTESTRGFERMLLKGHALEPSPVYFDRTFREGTSTVKLRNDGDAPLEISLSTRACDPLGVIPAGAKVTVGPHSTGEQAFRVMSRTADAADGAKIDVKWHAASSGPTGEPLELSGSSVLSVVRVLSARRVSRPIRVDGSLADWDPLPIVVDAPRQIQGDVTAWRGPEDSRFRLGVAYDAARLYVAVEVFDDTVRASAKHKPWAQDGVEIHLDARPDPVRAYSAGAEAGKAFLLLALSPSDSADDDWLYSPEWLKLPEGTEVACVRTRDGFVTEVSLPRAWVERSGGGSEGLVRLNVGVSDHDDDGRSVSWWWPDWRTPDDLPASGTLRLGP